MKARQLYRTVLPMIWPLTVASSPRTNLSSKKPAVHPKKCANADACEYSCGWNLEPSQTWAWNTFNYQKAGFSTWGLPRTILSSKKPAGHPEKCANADAREYSCGWSLESSQAWVWNTFSHQEARFSTLGLPRTHLSSKNLLGT